MPLKNNFISLLPCPQIYLPSKEARYGCFLCVSCAANQVSHVFLLHRICYDSCCLCILLCYLCIMNQSSSIFTYAFFLRNNTFKMAMPVFTLKSLKPEYSWTHDDHIRVQTTIVIIIIFIIITASIAIIFYSGKILLSDHVCDDIVISEESFKLETCNLLESWIESFFIFVL